MGQYRKIQQQQNNDSNAVIRRNRFGRAIDYNPLKILHQLLEHPKIAFVGISNWTLDAAKMNRMVMHSIPAMNHKDLEDTAKSIFGKADKHKNSSFTKDIEKLVQIYEKITQHKTNAFKPNGNKHFFGIRDFYALVKHQSVLKAQSISLEGYLRNFGGFEESKSSEQLRKILVEVLDMRDLDISNQFKLWTPVRCVQSNVTRKTILDNNSLQMYRHCM
ncbi:hypothetical protein RFI_06463, partial [Reticulomyxa filosa]